MSNTQNNSEHAATSLVASSIEAKVEVIVLPVSDVDRTKSFYQGLGWRVDADFAAEQWRVVQMTPTGSPCSIMFGKGFTNAAPGSVRGTFLVVDNIAATRAALAGRGVAVSDVFHFEGSRLQVAGTAGRVAGPDPEGRSYLSFATFDDPDGNSWLIQEVTTRLPGRGFGIDVATMTTLLRETEQNHGAYESVAPKHHWSDWYAPFLVARAQGRTTEDARADAALHMESVLGVGA